MNFLIFVFWQTLIPQGKNFISNLHEKSIKFIFFCRNSIHLKFYILHFMQIKMDDLIARNISDYQVIDQTL